MKLFSSFAALGLVALLGGGVAFAQTSVAVTHPGGCHEGSCADVVAKKCSAEADSEGLHGKARKNFRAECCSTQADRFGLRGKVRMRSRAECKRDDVKT